jgi:alcohol dehydrogenase (cytochrome c)
MKHKWLIALGIVVAVAAAVVVWGLNNKNTAIRYASIGVNWFRYLNAPAGTLQTFTAPGAQPASKPPVNLAAYDTGKDWASYNKTLTSDRFSPLGEINPGNIAQMKVLCTFKTGKFSGFNSGLLEVQGRLLFATEFDTYAIDPNDCHKIWQAHENYSPATPQNVSRGVAVMDGRVFRGTQDGRVLAYDFATGRKLWATAIADPKKAESTPAAPIAWNGMVFIGTAGGDFKDNRERMYALDAASGKILWEFYMVPKEPGDRQYGPEAPPPLNGHTWHNVNGTPITGGGSWTSYTLDPKSGLLYIPGGNPAPDFAQGLRKGTNLLTGSVVILDAKTGAYRGDFKLVPIDWHDWDVSSAPALIRTAGGRNMLVDAPKNGFLYGIDLSGGKLAYRVPVTRIENARVPFVPDKPVHFCPGTTGGSEWNGPAYDPANNLVMVGEVDWCNTAKLAPTTKVMQVKNGEAWSAEDTINPYKTWGQTDAIFHWGGWLSAVDADSGQWRWRVRTNFPIQSGVTPTQGGLVFFGDMGGNFYAVDAASGRKLWGSKIGGAIGGGVITYDAGRGQRVAAATGLTEVIWPSEITTAKVVVLGLR